MVSTMTVVIHQSNEALEGLQEDAKLLHVRPEGVRGKDAGDGVGVGEVPLLEPGGDGDLLQDGAEEQEALDDEVHARE